MVLASSYHLLNLLIGKSIESAEAMAKDWFPTLIINTLQLPFGAFEVNPDVETVFLVVSPDTMAVMSVRIL
jgi:hypothetical protein